MEEKGRRGIFFSRGMKALNVGLFLAAIGIFTVAFSLLVGLFENGFEWEGIKKGSDISYEETARCGSDAVQFLHRLPELVLAGEPFTTGGELDLKKKVDITNLSGDEKKNKNTTYTVDDIIQMEDDGIISQLESLLFDVRNSYYERDEYGYGEKFDGGEISEEPDNGIGVTGSGETAVEGSSADEDGETESGWKYSQAFMELYTRGKELEIRLPQSKISLAEYANENPESISLMDLYQSLVEAGEQLNQYRSICDELGQESNIMYMVKNTDSGTVYTNLSAWKNGYDESAVEGIDRTMFFRGVKKNSGWVSAEASTDAEKFLEEYYGNIDITGENEEIVIMLNSDYPVNDRFSDAQAYYQKFAKWGKWMLTCAIMSMLIGIVALILMTIQAGRTRDDRELHKGMGDSIPTEVMMAVIVISAALMTTVGIAYLEYSSVWDLFSIFLIDAGEIILGAISLMAYLSIVRRLKGKKMWKSSLCYTIVQSCKKVYMARQTSGRMIISFSMLMLGNIFGVLALDGFGILLALTADGLVLLYLIRERAGHQVIRDGLARIASGELDFKIDAGELIGDNREMAEAVNHVGDGLQNAVKETLKSERLKADLITNVSHDIKTPLTSIINYVDLLKREDIQDEKIKGYIDILDSKSQRLKQLTEDLVEASKISSGNVILDMQPIRLGELIRQTNGEFEEKFAARNLELVCRIPEQPVVIMADGHRMWRVIENLYNNVAKYAMPNTRIYVEVKRIGCRVVFEIKNISERPLNIRAEELTERFIRGDVSRSTEGSGLGLSIAQNLVKLQHGTFDIYLDGDLFKVTITFEAVGER